MMLKEPVAQQSVYNEDATHHASREKEACPSCFRLHEPDAHVCEYCGAVFFSLHTTKLDSTVLARTERSRRVGTATLDVRKPITLEIGTEHVILPVSDSLILGRVTPLLEEQPDVDLEPYMAHKYGISRLHIKIIRSHDLIYVTDLRSLNGTRLNGFRLLPFQERILRSGDELIIERLKVYVTF